MARTATAEHQPTQRLVPREKPMPRDALDMFDSDPSPPAPTPDPVLVKRKPTIDELFADYHQAHPEVYAEFVRLARLAKSKGHIKIGMKMLGELVRWHFVIDRDYDPENDRAYTLNNVLLSRYARLILIQERDLAGIFQTRKLSAK